MKRTTGTKNLATLKALEASTEEAWEKASQALEAAKKTGNASKIETARERFYAARRAHFDAANAALAADPKASKMLREAQARHAAIMAL